MSNQCHTFYSKCKTSIQLDEPCKMPSQRIPAYTVELVQLFSLRAALVELHRRCNFTSANIIQLLPLSSRGTAEVDLRRTKRSGCLRLCNCSFKALRKGSLYSGDAAPVSMRIKEDCASTSQTATGVRAAGDGRKANSPLYLHNLGRNSTKVFDGAVDKVVTARIDTASTSKLNIAVVWKLISMPACISQLHFQCDDCAVDSRGLAWT